MMVVIVKVEAMEKDSRTKMIESAASLIARRGLNAASFSNVLEESGAPRGSIYHHFPDGKEQLAADAIRWTSGRVLAFQRGNGGTTPRGVLERFTGMWRNVVIGSNAETGCVVAGTAVDSGAGDEGLMDVVRETFRSWTGLLSEQLQAAGLPAPRALAIATATVAGMEGALILCRAEGNVGPLDIVAAELLRLLP